MYLKNDEKRQIKEILDDVLSDTIILNPIIEDVEITKVEKSLMSEQVKKFNSINYDVKLTSKLLLPVKEINIRIRIGDSEEREAKEYRERIQGKTSWFYE